MRWKQSFLREGNFHGSASHVHVTAAPRRRILCIPITPLEKLVRDFLQADIIHVLVRVVREVLLFRLVFLWDVLNLLLGWRRERETSVERCGRTRERCYGVPPQDQSSPYQGQTRTPPRVGTTDGTRGPVVDSQNPRCAGTTGKRASSLQKHHDQEAIHRTSSFNTSSSSSSACTSSSSLGRSRPLHRRPSTIRSLSRAARSKHCVLSRSLKNALCGSSGATPATRRGVAVAGKRALYCSRRRAWASATGEDLGDAGGEEVKGWK